jgi:chromosome partitioning protein
MRVISVVSGKGGVGKTTLAFEFAHLLANKYRTLAIDLDPQASLTACFGAHPRNGTIADVIAGRATLPQILIPMADRLTLAPSGVELAGAEMALAGRVAREQVLKCILATVAASYDVVLIDGPPALGLLVSMALTASQGALIVTEPEAMNLASVRNVLDAVQLIHDEINPDLEVVGVLVNNYASHLNHHGEAMDALRGAKLPLMQSAIPRTIRLAEVPARHQPINTFDASHGAALALDNAYQELHRWLKKKTV